MADEPKGIFALMQRRDALRAELSALEAKIQSEFVALQALAESKGLSPSRARRTVNKMLTEASRAAISAGRTDPKAFSRRFLKTANEADGKYRTMRAVAEKIGVDVAFISRCLAGKQRVTMSRAEAIEKLIGYKASLANWPGGISSE